MENTLSLPKPLVLKVNDETFTRFLAIVKIYQLYFQLYKVDIIEDDVKDTIFVSINSTVEPEKPPVIYHWYEFMVSEIPDLLETLYQFNNNAEADYEVEELYSMSPRTMIEAVWDDLENWKGDQDVYSELLEMGSNISYIGILVELLISAFEEEKPVGIFPVGLIPLEKKLDSAYSLLLKETESEPEDSNKVKTLALDVSSFSVPKDKKDCESSEEEEEEDEDEEEEEEEEGGSEDEMLKSLTSLERVRSLEGSSGIYRIKCFK